MNAMILYSIACILVRKFFGLFTKTLDVTPPIFGSLKNPIIWDIAFLFGIESASLKPISSVFTYFAPKFFVPPAHPVFFGVTLVLIVAVFVFAVYMGNSYEEIMLEDEMTSITPEFPKTHWIMTHLLTVAICVAISIAIALYAKNKT